METHPAFSAELRELYNDQRNIALLGLAFVFSALLFLLVACRWYGSFWYYALSWPLIGILQYRVVIAGHEAVHKTLCYPLVLNEAFGALTQALVGVNFSAYRLQHFEHHRSTMPDNDPDGYIYAGVITSKKGLRRNLSWVFGIFVEIAVKLYQKGIGGFGNRRQQTSEIKELKRRHSFYVLLVQGLLFVLCWYTTQHWFGYFLLWFGPLITVAVFLNRSRLLVEHGLAHLLAHKEKEFEQGSRIPTIDLLPNPFERFLFAPFFFNFHASHHLFPSVPFYNLSKLSDLCDRHAVKGFFRLRQGYTTSIVAILRS